MHEVKTNMSASRLKIYVGNLPWTVGRKELKDYFSQFGFVKSSNVMFNEDTGISRGFGFVQFGNKQGLEATIQQESHHLEGSKLNIGPANEINRRRKTASEPDKST